MFQWPVEPRWRISSTWGERVHPVGGTVSFHGGIDIACPVGTEVKAPYDGVVAMKWNDGLYGGGRSLGLECVVPDAKGRNVLMRFGFAHLSDYMNGRQKGYSVKRGEVLALSGGQPGDEGAGKSTGAHLHMTVRASGQKVDPLILNWTIDFPGRERVPKKIDPKDFL